jgi:polynucleotide 5'-kinase involved in rRNA processing
VARLYWIGDAQTKGDPPYYLSCLTKLVDLWRSDAALRRRPLVVNMDGWVKGFGEALLSSAVEVIQPHVVLKLQGAHKYVAGGQHGPALLSCPSSFTHAVPNVSFTWATLRS